MAYQITRLIKRCPKCRSGRIYKRARMNYHHVGESDIGLKAYVCRNCKHEFEVPI